MTPQRDQHDQTDHDGAAPDPGAALPRVPAVAEVVFGDRLPLAQVFVEALATTGVAHGLIGPREIPRLWERHVLNCAVVAELVPRGASIVDVGSGAGLPGFALALACPASEVHLVEPRRRATDWLTATASAVGLDNVVVHQGRAQDVVGTVVAPVATARAVTRIGQLAQWCAPLTSAGGTLLALKGASVVTELEEDSAALRAAHVVDHEVVSCGAEILETPTTVARLYLGGRPRAGDRDRARGLRPTAWARRQGTPPDVRLLARARPAGHERRRGVGLEPRWFGPTVWSSVPRLVARSPSRGADPDGARQPMPSLAHKTEH